jgi:tape measure domain-containing protein
MSEDYDVKIKVDPGQAIPTVKDFGAALAATEQKTTATERAAVVLGRALYSLGQSMRADVVQGAAMGMRAFDGLTQALAREQSMLDRIHGPTRRYAEDLQVLDAMLQKNMVTTDQYAEQVTRLNRELEKRPHQEGSEGHGGFNPVSAIGGIQGGNVLAAFAGGGAVEGAIEGVKELGGVIGELTERADIAHERMVALKDAYTTLTNAAQKFADSGHTAAQILDEQRELAFRLHQPLRAVIETYDAVRDGTDELNLTHREQIKLTENLGRALVLSNKPLEQAGGIMERLSYAMASGTISTDELKRTMRQVPELAVLWTTAFHTTRVGLQDMINTGQVGVPDLMRVLISGGDGLNASWSKQVRTVAQWREAVEQAYGTARARGEDALHAMTTALRENADANISNEDRQRSAISIMAEVEHSNRKALIAIEASRQSQEAWDEAATRANVAMGSFTDTIENQIRVWNALGEVDPAKLLDEVESEARKLTDTFQNLGAVFSDAIVGDSVSERAERFANDFHRHTDDVRKDLQALKIDLEKGAISWDYYNKKRGEITGVDPKQDAAKKEQAERDADEYQRKLLSVDGLPLGGWQGKYLNDKVGETKQNIEKLQKDMQEAGEKTQREQKDQQEKAQREQKELDDKRLQELQVVAENKARMIAEAFQPVEDAFKHLFETGKFELSDFASSMEKMLTQLAFEMLAMGMSGGKETGLGSAIGHAIFGGGHASGGSYTVPGSGRPRLADGHVPAHPG